MPNVERPDGGVPRPEHTPPVALTTLARRAGAELFGPDCVVSGVVISNALARPGDLFAAVPGNVVHGARFSDQAIAAGAVAVLTDAAGREFVPTGTPVLLVNNVRAAVGPVSAAVYGDPSQALRIFGVTGTSGKTTTTHFLRAGLEALAIRSGLVGTVATMIGDEAVKTGFTTPEAPQVQALLAVMHERGMAAVAMEVSSHALALGRVDGIDFAVSAFTNLSQDHLEFHHGMQDYFNAKARLFDGRSAISVVMVDDDWGRKMANRIGGSAITVSTRGDDSATWQAQHIDTDASGRTTFTAVGRHHSIETGCAVPGRYNVANALLALAVLEAAGLDVARAAPAIAVAQVPGRMERIDAGQQFLAVVDYSHKPAAVDGALNALRPLTRGRLIAVLGCGGDRDPGKRAVMGEIAARGADLLVITDDNPRSEDPASIRRVMLSGAFAVPAGERGEIREIGDRAAAISAAVAAAAPGDTVLVAGKGHERGQQVGSVVHPFDDRVVLRAAIQDSGVTL